jgi:hypothetical protein
MTKFSSSSTHGVDDPRVNRFVETENEKEQRMQSRLDRLDQVFEFGDVQMMLDPNTMTVILLQGDNAIQIPASYLNSLLGRLAEFDFTLHQFGIIE